MTIDRTACPCRFAGPCCLFLVATPPIRAQTLHYTVNGTDNSTVAAGSVPNAARWQWHCQRHHHLSTDIPPTGASGPRQSLVRGGGARRVLAPGTKQLNNMAINNAGGFTYETWFKWNGSGNINAVIDYAGTQKLIQPLGQSGPEMQYYDTNNSPVTISSTRRVQPMALRRGGVHRDRADTHTNLTGNFTFYLDAKAPIGSVSGVTISQFGDNLNRTIRRGHAPGRIFRRFFQRPYYEPRITWGVVRLQLETTKCVRLQCRRFRRGFPAGRRCQCEQWRGHHV